jgi:hypothetical protein
MQADLSTVFIFLHLLIAFQLKHYLIDFVVQINDPDGMKKFNESGWFFPLLKHASQHGLWSLIIAWAYFATMTLLGFIDFTWGHVFVVLGIFVFDTVIHFTMDRIKASPYMLGRFKPTQRGYWYSLGADQMVHHLTHYVIIAFIILY